MSWGVRLLIFLIIAGTSHLVVLSALPGYIMEQARGRLIDRGLQANTWLASPQMTPQTQTIVRPSPDLSYAICLFDTRDAPVYVEAPRWDAYGSLSVFNDQTDNIAVINLEGFDGAASGLILGRADQDPDTRASLGMAPDTKFVEFNGKGLALIRRLAPDQESHKQATLLVRHAKCEQVNRPSEASNASLSEN